MLIAEDNDDMRKFIKQAFSDTYEVIEAANGLDGIQKATDRIPDIIISDVMMPELDGLELTGTLKNDFRTSHIPVIMLTAKAEDQDKLKGLETGADDYIVKPFKSNILKAKVKSLLDNRAKLRTYYNHEVVLKPAIFSYNKTEEKFFIKLQEVIDEKLQDPDFNVDSFSKYMGMNRMQLHRKLTSMLGVTASEFIRNERLKAAKTLLQNEHLTISEVAYMSGFNDANYFSKSFKNLFKMTPKDFRESSS
jgi:DNA-binding response OmpR family regulator